MFTPSGASALPARRAGHGSRPEHNGDREQSHNGAARTIHMVRAASAWTAERSPAVGMRRQHATGDAVKAATQALRLPECQ